MQRPHRRHAAEPGFEPTPPGSRAPVRHRLPGPCSLPLLLVTQPCELLLFEEIRISCLARLDHPLGSRTASEKWETKPTWVTTWWAREATGHTQPALRVQGFRNAPCHKAQRLQPLSSLSAFGVKATFNALGYTATRRRKLFHLFPLDSFFDRLFVFRKRVF